MYLNVVQLADSFGVEENIVEDWIRKDGLPCVKDRGRHLFDPAQVVAGLPAIVFLRDALLLEEPPSDGVPVNRLLFFIATSPRAHLEWLAQLSTALSRGELRARLIEAAPDADILASLAAADGQRVREALREGAP